ncbi:MAG: hypothetical protein VKK59_01365 [Vampirovibrionales bacterium]|nr:hypothetical protein [Vampirovibrionales bacterium]
MRNSLKVFSGLKRLKTVSIPFSEGNPLPSETQRLLLLSWQCYGVLSILVSIGLWGIGHANWMGFWLAGCGLGVLFWKALWPVAYPSTQTSPLSQRSIKSHRWMGSLLRMAGYGLMVVLIGGSEPWPTAWVLLGLGSWHVSAMMAAISQLRRFG